MLLAAGVFGRDEEAAAAARSIINSGDSEELQQVPGIGPATADKILQMRKSYGAFKSVDDLLAIRGIGKKRLDKMRKYLIAGEPATARNPAPRASPRGAWRGARLRKGHAASVTREAAASATKPNFAS